MDRDEILRVLRAFEGAGLEYVLIGATAMGFHGLVRATEDVDVLVRASAENIERLRKALLDAYPGDSHVEEITAEDLLGQYPAVRYYPPTGDLYFNIMTRLGTAASFDTVASEVKETDGIRVRVATPAALYELSVEPSGRSTITMPQPCVNASISTRTSSVTSTGSEIPFRRGHERGAGSDIG